MSRLRSLWLAALLGSALDPIAAAGPAAPYATQLQTAEFDFEIGNSLTSGWSQQALLWGRVRVDAQGRLRLRVAGLRIAAAGPCAGQSPSSCQIESLRLLLTREGGENFSTLAASAPLTITADLNETPRWRLAQGGQELLMQLPPQLAADGLRLRLELRSRGNETIYPDDGPQLRLYRVLAEAAGRPDPCGALTTLQALVDGGCEQVLRQRLEPRLRWQSRLLRWTRSWLRRLGLAATAAPAQRGTEQQALDAALPRALEQRRFELLPLLLAAGADPLAPPGPEQESGPLLRAAAADEPALLEQLLEAGAELDAQEGHEGGAAFSALSMAVRHDAARAVAFLLDRGASMQLADRRGWTLMHVAAYGNALHSLPLLLKRGASVNERSGDGRHSTALMSAVRLASAATVRAFVAAGSDLQARDAEAKTACDWASFFERGAAIEALVCPAQRGDAAVVTAPAKREPAPHGL